VSLNYEKAPLIFEVRGLPMKAGMRAMDSFHGSRIGVVVRCEGGYVIVSESGGVVMFDNDNKRIKSLNNGGAAQHRANFIAAVKSRKQADIVGTIAEGHISSALCHLGNISHRLGSDRANEAIQEAIHADAETSDSFARMMDHLAANQVDVKTRPSVMGPLLKVAPGKESFVTAAASDIGAAANRHLRRDYRAPFVVPEQV